MEEPIGSVSITKRQLSDEEAMTIGRIVRACADLEDCLNLWICKLAGTDEAKAAVILRRSNISTKIAIAEGLANLKGGEALKLHKEAFDDSVDRLLQCRNAVAHGVLAGVTDEGALVFVSTNTVGYEDDALVRRADAYTLPALSIIAGMGMVRAVDLNDRLGLGPLRRKRPWRRVPIRQAGQTKNQRAAKGARQRRGTHT